MSAHSTGNFENKRGLSVEVRNNNVEGAIRLLGRKFKQEGIAREARARSFFEKPSTVRRKAKMKAISRARKDEAAKNRFK